MPSSETGAFWPIILEKAYAKLHVSYERIYGGGAQEVLRGLTGAPFKENPIWREMDRAKILAKLRFWIEKKYPMSSPVGKRKRKEYPNGQHPYGLLFGHTYSPLDIIDLKDPSGNVAHTLIKFRPHNYGFKGPWA